MMNKLFLSIIGSLLLSMTGTPALAQNVGIGTTSPATSAALDVTAPANDKGFLPPRLTELQRNAIASPAAGLVIFNTDSKRLNVWDGAAWTAAIGTTETAYVPGSQTFTFTGGPQVYTVPRGVTSVLVDARGASGLTGISPTDGSNTWSGGRGGRVQATLAVTPGEVLTVQVGGAATRSFVTWYSNSGQPPPVAGSGGYNGGGQSFRYLRNSGQAAPGLFVYYYEYWGGGGGATDLRRGGTALANRVLVAAGGGGATTSYSGGDGGAPNGTAGNGNAGQGATQAAGGAAGGIGNAQPGTLGQGGSGNNGGSDGGGGGGGGYYGGGGGGGHSAGGFGSGGGGGSSYAGPGATAVTYTSGANAGDGSVTISPVPAVQYAAPAISGANVVLPAASADGAVVFTGTPGLKTNGSQFFWDNATNRLGIGTASPTFSVHSTGGFYSSGASGEFTFADRADNSKRFSWYASGDRATLWHSVGGDRLSVLANGNVGIGYNNPSAKLDVVGGGGYYVDLLVNGRIRSGDGGNTGGMYVNSAQSQFVGQYDANRLGLYNNTWGLVMNNSGRVGIGTTDPAVPLDVQGGASIGTYYFAYYNVFGPGSSGFSNSNQPDVTIRASGRVVAAEFNATSDRRIKNVIGLSDNATDLGLLTKLRITDYTMRDRALYGERKFKKVIAQEVEEVFPQAVHRQTGFLPDVYAVAAGVRSEGDSLVLISLPAGLPTGGATAGQRLKLMGPKGETIGTVARPAAAEARQLLLRGAQVLVGADKVFVFGLEHSDVRAVDYEALAMLNVSATQELARQLAVAQAQLQQQTTAATAALGSFEQRLRALEAAGGQAQR